MSAEPKITVRCVGFSLDPGQYELRLFHSGCWCVTPIELHTPGEITITLTSDERAEIKRIDQQNKD